MTNPIPYILKAITGKHRDKVDIIWSSKSWVHNIFRFWELIAWRKRGIRAEMSTIFISENGRDTVYYNFHSFEALCAYGEHMIREALKFRLHFPYKIVRMQLVTSGGIKMPSPFVFAIAHDADGTPSITNAFGGTATKTFTHVTTGSNTLLTGVYALWQDVAGTGTVTANTYNSVALAKTEGLAQASMRSELWWQKAPTTGSNTMSVTVTGNTDAIKLCSSSFTGVDQSTTIDAHSNAVGSAGNPVASVTTVAADTVVVAVLSRFSTTAASSNKTSIFNNATGSVLGAAAYELAAGAAGSKSNTYTGTAAQDWSMCIASFKPVVSVTSTNGFFKLM